MPDPPFPTGPIDTPPIGRGGYLTRIDRRAMLADVLAGVVLGAYDERILDWLAGLDEPTMLTIASLIWRTRASERAPWGGDVAGGLEQ